MQRTKRVDLIAGIKSNVPFDKSRCDSLETASITFMFQYWSAQLKPAEKSYTIYVFGGQTARAVPNVQILPMSVYRLAIASGKNI